MPFLPEVKRKVFWSRRSTLPFRMEQSVFELFIFVKQATGGEIKFMIVFCAWCGKFIRFKDAPGAEPRKSPISHGICPDCREKLYAETASLVGVKHQ